MDENIRAYAMPENDRALPAETGKCYGGIYVPVQTDGRIWPPEEALARGTAFPCLFNPWQKGEIFCE